MVNWCPFASVRNQCKVLHYIEMEGSLAVVT